VNSDYWDRGWEEVEFGRLRGDCYMMKTLEKSCYSRIHDWPVYPKTDLHLLYWMGEDCDSQAMSWRMVALGDILVLVGTAEHHNGLEEEECWCSNLPHFLACFEVVEVAADNVSHVQDQKSIPQMVPVQNCSSPLAYSDTFVVEQGDRILDAALEVARR